MESMNTEAKKVIKAVKIEHDHGLRDRVCRKREGEPSGGDGCPMGKRCETEDEEEDADEANGIIMGGFGAAAQASGVEAVAAAVEVS